MSRGVVDSPYVGLVPYTEEEAHFFFGRENDQNVIIANMFAARLTILYGASGVGKSSLLRAGVMRELRKRVDAARAEGRAPDLAVVYFNDWKADALAALKLALQKELAEVGVSGIDAQLSLAAMLRAAAAKFEGDVMFIFDQFEEYFLYHTREVSTGSFAYEFAAAANDLSLPVSFLLSLRDDALSRLDRFKAIIPNLFSNYLRLRHLTRVQAERSVKLPIDAYNSLPAEERAHSATIAIEPHLVTMILEQVRQDRVLSAADGRGVVAGIEDVGIETPYLQLVLKRVWAEEVGKDSSVLRADTLTDLGGADQIVGTHLETVLSGLDDNEKEICARMFRYMVTPGGTKIAHTVTDLAEFAKVSEDNVTGVLRKLSEPATRIVSAVASVGADGPLRYEIYHDSLAHAILEWCKIHIAKKEQEEKERAYAFEAERQRKEVAQAQDLATAQRERAEEHARSAKRLGVMVGALVVLLGFLAVASVTAVNQSRKARQNAKRATVSEQLAAQSEAAAESARSSQAAYADSLLKANGLLTEAQALRNKERIAQAASVQSQQSRASDVNFIIQAQSQRDDALRQLQKANERIKELDGRLSSKGSEAVAAPAPAPVDVVLDFRLTEVYTIHDGSGGGTRWKFTLRHDNSDFLGLAPRDFNNDRSPVNVEAAGRFPSRVGQTETITITGERENIRATGTFIYYVKPTRFGVPETIQVPVIVWGRQDNGSFVVVLEVTARATSY
jgi:hypothetical protein